MKVNFRNVGRRSAIQFLLVLLFLLSHIPFANGQVIDQLSQEGFKEIRDRYHALGLLENVSSYHVEEITLTEDAFSNHKDFTDAINRARTVSTQTTNRRDGLIVVNTSAATQAQQEIKLDSALSINSGNVTIVSMGATDLTIKGNLKARIFDISGTSTVVNMGGLTLTNGHAGNGSYTVGSTNGGGGIRNNGATVCMMYCTITKNRAFENAAGTSGGGIYNQSGIVTLINCSITGNTSTGGGYGNRYGGGIRNNGTMNIRNTVIAGNRVRSGYGANPGGVHGGGIYNDGRMTLTNCTIAGNVLSKSYWNAGISGAGIYNASGTLTIRNSIVAHNRSHNSSENPRDIRRGGGTVTGSYNLISTALSGTTDLPTSTNIIGTATRPTVSGFVNPRFQKFPSTVNSDNTGIDEYDEAAWDFRLQSSATITSPAIDAGNNTYASDVGLTTDRDGEKRFNGIVDMGAYEYCPPISDVRGITKNSNIWGQRMTVSQDWVYVSYTGGTYDVWEPWKVMQVYSYIEKAEIEGTVFGTATEKKPGVGVGFNFADAIQGAMAGADAGAALGPWGAVGGFIAGAIGGGVSVSVSPPLKLELDAKVNATNTQLKSGVVNNRSTIEIATVYGHGDVKTKDGRVIDTVTGSLVNFRTIGKFDEDGYPIFDENGGTTSTFGADIGAYGSLSNTGSQAKISSAIISGSPKHVGSLYANSKGFLSNADGANVGLVVVDNHGDLTNALFSKIGLVTLKPGGALLNTTSAEIDTVVLSGGTAQNDATIKNLYHTSGAYTGTGTVRSLTIDLTGHNLGGRTLAAYFLQMIGGGVSYRNAVANHFGCNVSHVSWVDSLNSFILKHGNNEIDLAIPTNLRSTVQTANSISLAWDAPTAGNKSRYVLERSTDGTNWTTVSNTIITTSFAVTGLDANRNYHFRVAAANAQGQSAWSNVLQRSTSRITLTAVTPSTNSPQAGTAITTTLAPAGATATYQWYRGATSGNVNTVISGATSSSYTPVAADIGQFLRVQATGTGNFTGTVNHTLANEVLPANQAPVITTQPVSQTVTAGQNATFSVVATGTPAPTYQWQESTDGGSTFTNISGATGTTLTRSNATVTMNNFRYRVIVTNVAGSVTSNAVTLTVNTLPVITTQPVSQTITAGQGVTFSVVATGSPVPTYQWQVSTNGGGTWTNAGTGSTLTLTNVTATMNNYRYRVVVSNSAGNVTSNVATLTIPTITNDEFNAIRSQYGDLNLLADMADYNNIIVVRADQLSQANLQNAINAAGDNNLVVLRTTPTQNSVTLNGTPLSINSGNRTIVSLGDSPLTIDGGGRSRVFNIGTNATAELAGLTIRGGNVNGDGGGGILNSGKLTLINSEITGNSTDRDGGGIRNLGTAIITNTIIAGNTSATGGGGISSDSATGMLVVTNCVIVENTATAGNGGGIFAQAGSILAVTNSTISQNSANLGGGIRTLGIATVNNTIVAENSANTGLDISNVGTLSGGWNLIGTNTGQTAFVDKVNGNIVGTLEKPVDPLFADAANGDYRLTACSPAADNGNDAFAALLTVDLDDNPRFNGTVDIGAYEYQGTVGHDYEETSYTEPTCTEDGYWTYTCTDCGNVVIEIDEGTAGHDYEEVYTDPTCTEDGYWTYTCNDCGNVVIEVDEGSALCVCIPVNLRVVQRGQGAVSLQWNAVHGAAGYIVKCESPDGEVEEFYTDVARFVDTGLDADTTYVYSVRTLTSDFSMPFFVTTLPSAATDVPIILSTTTNEFGQTTIEWTDLGEDYTYTIVRQGQIIARDVSGTSFFDANPPASWGVLEYGIRAFNESTQDSARMVTTTVWNTNIRPVEFTGFEITEDGVQLFWDAVPDTEYQVMRLGTTLGRDVTSGWTDTSPMARNDYVLMAFYEVDGRPVRTYSDVFTVQWMRP